MNPWVIAFFAAVIVVGVVSSFLPGRQHRRRQYSILRLILLAIVAVIAIVSYLLQHH